MVPLAEAHRRRHGGTVFGGIPDAGERPGQLALFLISDGLSRTPGCRFRKKRPPDRGKTASLRVSNGGELRLQLPLIGQLVRLIFAWNPLRLQTLIEDSPGAARIVDPCGAIRFALGKSLIDDLRFMNDD
jgi:hypothetical protein